MRMFRLFAAIVVTACACGASAAELFREEKTPGGLSFWYLQRPEAHRSTVVAGFADVFALNHPDKIGAPAVGASLLRSGPKGITAGEFNEQLRDLQAGGGVSAAPMTATFSVEAKPEDLGAAMDLYIRILTEPALRQRDLTRYQKSNVIARAQIENSPTSIAAWLTRRLTMGNSPFGNWSEPEAIGKVTLEDIDQWRREVFARDNATIIAVGKEDAATFAAHIDRAWSRLPEKARAREGEAPKLSFNGKTIVLEREMQQTAVVMQGPLEFGSLAEALAFTIGNNAFGGGMDRRLGRAIRQGQGATYGIGSSVGQPTPRQRTFNISSSFGHDLAAGAIARTKQEYDKWRREGVSEQEAAASRSLLATGFDRGVESPGGKAQALLSMFRSGRTAQEEATYTERLRGIGVAEVNRIVREKAPEKFTTVIVAPKAEGFGADCVIKALEEIDRCR